MSPFPVAKLVYLAVKQISKPVARVIKTRAKSNAFFRNYILLPPAQLYHKAEATVKLRILGIGKKSAVHVKKMDEDTAIELASEMLGEVIVFVVATATLYFEYRRQCRKDIVKEERQNDRLTELEEVIVALQGQIAEQSSQIEQVKHLLKISNLNIPEKITDKKSGLVLRVERKNKQVDVEIV